MVHFRRMKPWMPLGTRFWSFLSGQGGDTHDLGRSAGAGARDGFVVRGFYMRCMRKAQGDLNAAFLEEDWNLKVTSANAHKARRCCFHALAGLAEGKRKHGGHGQNGEGSLTSLTTLH